MESEKSDNYLEMMKIKKNTIENEKINSPKTQENNNDKILMLAKEILKSKKETNNVNNNNQNYSVPDQKIQSVNSIIDDDFEFTQDDDEFVFAEEDIRSDHGSNTATSVTQLSTPTNGKIDLAIRLQARQNEKKMQNIDNLNLSKDLNLDSGNIEKRAKEFGIEKGGLEMKKRLSDLSSDNSRMTRFAEKFSSNTKS